MGGVPDGRDTDGAQFLRGGPAAAEEVADGKPCISGHPKECAGRRGMEGVSAHSAVTGLP